MTKAQTLAVNENNDLYLDKNGNIAIVYDLDATLQACQQAAQTILGEMVLQTDQGVPYFESVFIGSPNIAIYEAALKVAFLGVTGVEQIKSLTLTRENGVLSYIANIQTIYGLGVING